MPALEARTYGTPLGCGDHECHKQHRRDAAAIALLRRELEASRDGVDELEAELERLEGLLMQTLGRIPAASAA